MYINFVKFGKSFAVKQDGWSKLHACSMFVAQFIISAILLQVTTFFHEFQSLTGFAYSSKFRVLKTFEVFKDRIPSPVSFDVALPVSFEDDFSVVMLWISHMSFLFVYFWFWWSFEHKDNIIWLTNRWRVYEKWYVLERNLMTKNFLGLIGNTFRKENESSTILIHK